MYTGLNDGRIVTFNDTDITTVLHMGPPPYDKCGKIYTHTHTHQHLTLTGSASQISIKNN